MRAAILQKLAKPQPFVLAAILIFLKAILLRYFLFEQIAWGQLAADAASIVFLTGLFELIAPAPSRKYVLWGINLLASILFFAASVYFSYFGTVPTYSALHEADQVTGVKESVQASIQTRYYLFFADLVVLAAAWIALRLAGRRAARARKSRAWNLGVAIAAVAGLIVSSLYIQNAQSIENELAQAENVGFFNYQISTVLKEREAAAKVKDVDLALLQEEVGKLESAAPDVKPAETAADAQQPGQFGAMKGKNLIVIQMEAFQNFPMHLSVNGQELTPVLNGLADDGYYFPHYFQQIGQGNTSDAEFMTNTSIYPTAKVAMSTGYGDRDMPSLPKLLRKYGYVSETFHVNDVTFWDRDKLYPALGFDRYHDKPEFQNDKFNAFGASDEELYRVATERMAELQQQGKPFYMHLITASSHHPFKIPKDKQWIKLPKDIQGTQLGDYLQAVHYTDYAIGQLIERLKAAGLYDNTMIAIYGDHFGLQPNDNPPEEVSKKLGITYHERISRFNIPLVIHTPGASPRRVVTTVGGQVDLMPTLANLLGISLKDEGYTAFGHDLLNTDKNVIGMRYYLPTGSFFNNDILFVPGKSFEDGIAYSLETMQQVTDFAKYREDYDYVLKLMGLSDTFVQSLPQR